MPNSKLGLGVIFITFDNGVQGFYIVAGPEKKKKELYLSGSMNPVSLDPGPHTKALLVHTPVFLYILWPHVDLLPCVCGYKSRTDVTRDHICGRVLTRFGTCSVLPVHQRILL